MSHFPRPKPYGVEARPGLAGQHVVQRRRSVTNYGWCLDTEYPETGSVDARIGTSLCVLNLTDPHI